MSMIGAGLSILPALAGCVNVGQSLARFQRNSGSSASTTFRSNIAARIGVKLQFCGPTPRSFAAVWTGKPVLSQPPVDVDIACAGCRIRSGAGLSLCRSCAGAGAAGFSGARRPPAGVPRLPGQRMR
jgi:hypothetical protein